jgi:hypothetical protein
MENRTVAMSHRVYVDHCPCPPIRGSDGAEPALPLLVGMALMVMVELADTAFAGMDDGLAEHVAPVSDCGTVQATVSADGNGEFSGVVVKSIFTVAGVPAVTVIVPGVEASCVRVMPTIWNCRADEVPPPGAGLVTVTLTAPAVAVSVAAIDAFTCVALTNVVVFAAPLKFNTEEELKFVPVTVRVKAAPFVALAGESEAAVGNGLFTVKGEFPDVPPPGAGFVTVTLNVPAVAISAAVMDAVTCVAFTNVVVTAVPLKFTTEVATKFVPFTVSVKVAPPAVALVGESDVIAGRGLLTVKV